MRLPYLPPVFLGTEAFLPLEAGFLAVDAGFLAAVEVFDEVAGFLAVEEVFFFLPVEVVV